MKTLIVFSILLCGISVPALGALTDTDLDKIRLIVNDSEKRIKAEVKIELTDSEKRIKEYVDLKMDSVEKRLSTYNWVMGVLMPLIVAAIGIPTVIMAWRGRKDDTRQNQIETHTEELQNQMERLTAEIETLKKQQRVQ